MPKKNKRNNPWTPEEIDQLRKALDNAVGATVNERADFVAQGNWHGRTVESIRNKARSMGYQIPPDKAAVVPDDATREAYLKEIQRLEKSLENHRLFTQEFRREMSAGIKELPALEVPKFKPTPVKKGEKHGALLVLSDCHVGTAFEVAHISGAGEAYNFDMFCNRAGILTDKVKQITELNRAYASIDNLTILLLGDIVEGEEIYRSQRSYIDRKIIQQTTGAAEVLSRAIADLAGNFKSIRCLSVWGNHGRISKDYADDQNFDVLVYEFMKLRLAPIKNVKFFISEAPRMAFQIPELAHEGDNFTWVAWHGDDVRAYFKLPYYNLESATSQLVALNNIPIHYFIIGHHHRHAEIDTPHGRSIINGSWVGSSPLSTGPLRTGSLAKQMYFILHPEQGITSSWDLKLSKRWKLKPDAEGLMTSYR